MEKRREKRKAEAEAEACLEAIEGSRRKTWNRREENVLHIAVKIRMKAWYQYQAWYLRNNNEIRKQSVEECEEETWHCGMIFSYSVLVLWYWW